MAGDGPRRPSVFFLVLLPAFAVGVVVAALAGDRHPVYALGSNVVWRCEVGAVVFGILYVVTLILSLAWQGRAPKRIGGGPASVDTTPQDVDSPQLGADTEERRIGFEFP